MSDHIMEKPEATWPPQPLPYWETFEAEGVTISVDEQVMTVHVSPDRRFITQVQSGLFISVVGSLPLLLTLIYLYVQVHRYVSPAMVIWSIVEGYLEVFALTTLGLYAIQVFIAKDWEVVLDRARKSVSYSWDHTYDGLAPYLYPEVRLTGMWPAVWSVRLRQAADVPGRDGRAKRFLWKVGRVGIATFRSRGNAERAAATISQFLGLPALADGGKD